MRFIKNFFGVVCCIATLVWAIMAIVEKQPAFLVSCAVGVLLAVLLLRKTNKEKQKKAMPKFEPTVQEGEFCTVITEVEPSVVPADIANDMAKYYTIMQARRDAEIMRESFSLASSTSNLDTFCARYELAMRKAHTLLQAEQVGVHGIKKLNCHNTCVSIIEAATTLKVRALHDYAQEEMHKAEELKTDRGKCNRYIKMLSVLEKAEPTFTLMDEYEALIAEIKEHIAQLGGTVPITHQ